MRRLMRWLCAHELELNITACCVSVLVLASADNPLQLPAAPAIVTLLITASLLALLRLFFPDETE
jgi:hypothetical protein